MRIGKKKMLKWIEEESKKLPDMYYTVRHRYYRPTMVLSSDGEREIKTDYLEKHKVNHKRRLKRVWKNYGIKEVSNYFLLYGFALVDKEKGS